MAEQDQNGNWTDYIYGNGQKIARVAGAMPVLQMKGHRDPATNYMGCGVSTAIDNIAALSAQLGPIQPGDVFAFDLREPVTDSGITAQGGIGVWTNGAGITTSTTSGLTPWNDTVATGAWQHMVVPIGQAVPGETLTTLDFDMQNGTPAGDYELDYANVVIARANGTIIPVFTGQPVTFSLAGGGGELSANPVTACGATNLTAVVSSLPVDASVGTNYYLDDHLGTTQMELSSGGWPVWSGAFTPFGQEIINGTTTNYIGAQPADGTAMHYKFTGKERDAESGLDYFGARYYGSSIGRFTSPDWSATVAPVPYAKLSDPQTLNLYSYVRNNPLNAADIDGHSAGSRVGSEIYGSGGEEGFWNNPERNSGVAAQIRQALAAQQQGSTESSDAKEIRGAVKEGIKIGKELTGEAKEAATWYNIMKNDEQNAIDPPSGLSSESRYFDAMAEYAHQQANYHGVRAGLTLTQIQQGAFSQPFGWFIKVYFQLTTPGIQQQMLKMVEVSRQTMVEAHEAYVAEVTALHGSSQ